MTDYTVEDLASEQHFSKPVYLDRGFVIAAPGMAVTAGMIAALREWKFESLRSEGKAELEASSEEAPAAETESTDSSESWESEQLKKAEALYQNFQGFVGTLFTQMETYIPPNYNMIAEKIRDLCDIIRHDRRYLLRVIENADEGEGNPAASYLVSHTVKSTILAIIIGSYLKLPSHRLIELGVATVLHEAGMLSLSAEVYTGTGALTQEEQKAILSHPLLGYKLLKSFDLPLSVAVAALEHHERENGGGYPRRLTGDKISFYSKIIAVACSYEAQTSKRPYKMTKDSFSGMVDMLKNEGKQYDDTVIRALVFSLSIYPIGLHVLLSDGRKGQVVDVNQEAPRYPLVQLLGTAAADGKITILKTCQGGVHILRPLGKDELG
ncbi:phosphohydrolase [Spirochaetia bacterium]|nr:phosphohydrolase [Spirochaetia bacterium]